MDVLSPGTDAAKHSTTHRIEALRARILSQDGNNDSPERLTTETKDEFLS